MTVSGLSVQKGFEAAAMPQGDREITGVYIGDLLSWVMGRANEGDAWITIMSNINIIAVASLADTACIILAEDVMPDAEIINKAQEKGINILKTSKDIYETALMLSELI